MAISFIEHFRAARRTSTPLLFIQTADPASTMKTIAYDANEKMTPMILWDNVRGVIDVNEPHGKVLAKQLNEGMEPGQLANPVEMLLRALMMSKEAILFMANLHLCMKDHQVIQALWNLRDAFKTNTRTLVGLGPDITLPPELSSDVLILDEPLPDNAQMEKIIIETYDAVGQLKKSPKGDILVPSPEALSHGKDALCGLAAFPAEQVCAMSIRKDGLDMEQMWERKRQAVEQTQGLSIARGIENFDDVTGLENAKQYHRLRANGPRRRRVVVFIDEIDKHLAGFGAVGTGDTTTEMTGALLTDMQDNEAEGSLFLGVAGAGKTLLAKAIANFWAVPCIVFDLSGMKGSLVGQSGENIRNALKVVHAVSQGNPYYIATCNRIENLPPELRRRFTSATFFFDLPTKAERDASWKLYEKKFEVNGDRPDDIGWTGAEIRNCCYNAHVLSCSLLEAAQYIVPLSKSAGEQITALRKQADGRFISASRPGMYTAPEGIQDAEDAPTIVGVIASVPAKRKITTGSGNKGMN